MDYAAFAWGLVGTVAAHYALRRRIYDPETGDVTFLLAFVVIGIFWPAWLVWAVRNKGGS